MESMENMKTAASAFPCGGEAGVGAGGEETRIDLRRNAPAGLSDVGRKAA